MLDTLKSRFGDEIQELPDLVGHKTFLVPAGKLVDVALFLKLDPGLGFNYLNCLSGIDRGKEEPRFEVSYIMSSLVSKEMIQLKVRVNDGDQVPSVSAIWKTADWHEREAFDLLGIVFSGRPGLRRILLPEGWIGHPLRKDYVVADSDKVQWERDEADKGNQ